MFPKQGNFDVPKKHGVRLNSFVTTIRKAMRRKREGYNQKELTEDRINRLNSINFAWESKRGARPRSADVAVEADDYLYDLLADFKEHYGHVQVAKMMLIWRGGAEVPAKPEYKRLASFIASVRNEHELYLEGKPCAILDDDKVRRLTELGVKWKRPGEFDQFRDGKRLDLDISRLLFANKKRTCCPIPQ
jgi:hypothetical protein